MEVQSLISLVVDQLIHYDLDEKRHERFEVPYPQKSDGVVFFVSYDSIVAR